MNAAAWTLLADRSRVLVHHASLTMGVLTGPASAQEPDAAVAAVMRTSAAVQALMPALAAAPELAAHLRKVQRFAFTLAAWQRCVAEASPLAQRYQTALMQQAAQVVISCLHVEGLAASECARGELSRQDLTTRKLHSPE